MVNFKYFFIIFSFFFLSSQLLAAENVVESSKPNSSNTSATNTTNTSSNSKVESVTSSKSTTNNENNSDTTTNSKIPNNINSKQSSSSNNKTNAKEVDQQTNNKAPVVKPQEDQNKSSPTPLTEDEKKAEDDTKKAEEIAKKAQLEAEEKAKKAKEEAELRKQEKAALEEVMKIVNDDYGFLEEVPADNGNILNLTKGNDDYAIIYTDNGNIVIQLYPDAAPNTVKAFKTLVRAGFYNDTEFFKVLPDYLAQAGDPTSSGYGGTGKKRDAEISDKTFTRGTVAISNQGNLHSDDSQFFISFNSFPWLDKKYTIFGKVISGMPILENLPASYKNDGILDEPLTINKIMIASDVAKAAIENEKQKSDTNGLQNKIPGLNATKVITPSKTATGTVANSTNKGGATNGQPIPNVTSKGTQNATSSASASGNSKVTTTELPSTTDSTPSASSQTQNSTSLYGPTNNKDVPPIQIAPRDNSTSLYGNFGK